MRDHAHTLSDFRVPTLSIECEPCGRAGCYNVARLMEQYGDAKLPELLYVLADCPKAKAASVHDRCKAVYGRYSRWSTSDSVTFRACGECLMKVLPCLILTSTDRAPS